MWLVVGFILDALEALGLHGGGWAQVGDGVRAVLKIQSVAGGVQSVDGGHAVQMVLPGLVRVKDVNPAACAPWDVVNCGRDSGLMSQSMDHVPEHSGEKTQRLKVWNAYSNCIGFGYYWKLGMGWSEMLNLNKEIVVRIEKTHERIEGLNISRNRNICSPIILSFNSDFTF